MRPEHELRIRASRGISQAMEDVGCYIFAAICEIADEIGGEDLELRIARIANTGEILPHPDAITTLEGEKSGATKQVFARIIEIQEAAHERERHKLN